RGFGKLGSQPRTQRFGFVGLGPEFGSSIRQADRDAPVFPGHAIGGLRQIQTEADEQAVAGRQAETHPVIALVVQGGFGKHGELAQVGELRFDQFPGHRQQVSVVFREDAEARLHAPLGRATGAEAGLAGVEIAKVAGQLSLQKFAGIGAAYGQDAFMRQDAEKSSIGHDRSPWKNQASIIAGPFENAAWAPLHMRKVDGLPVLARAVILRRFTQGALAWLNNRNSIVCSGRVVVACWSWMCCWCPSSKRSIRSWTRKTSGAIANCSAARIKTCSAGSWSVANLRTKICAAWFA